MRHKLIASLLVLMLCIPESEIAWSQDVIAESNVVTDSEINDGIGFGEMTESSLIEADLKNAIEDPDISYEIKNDPEYRKMLERKSGASLSIAATFGAGLNHDERFAKSEKLYGVDVSKWQKNIDWASVKKNDVDFAIIRLGYRGSENGTLSLDTYYKKNMEAAKAAGMNLGVYFFTQAINETEAKAEAAYVVEQLSAYPGYLSYPVYFDIEDLAGGRMEKAKLTTAQRTAICKAFCEEIEKSGYSVGVYANKYWLENQLTMSSLEMYNVWYARYNNTPGYSGKYQMWQYTSTASVSGIAGGVDMSVAYKSGKPDKPTGLAQKSGTDNSIGISWEQVSMADGYSVYVYSASGDEIMNFDVEGTSASVDLLEPGSTYTVKVKAFYNDIDGSKTYGSFSQGLKARTLPGVVSGIQTTASSLTDMTLSWDKLQGADGYRIRIYDKVTGSFDVIGSTSKNTYLVEGLAKGTKYSYTIQPFIKTAAGTKLYGDVSEEYSDYTKMAQVKDLTLNTLATDKISVTWADMADISGYIVKVYNTSDELIQQDNVASNEYTISNLSAGSKYIFKVASYKDMEDGKQVFGQESEDFEVITKPGKVQNVRYKSSTTSAVTITWDKFAEATGYNVYLYDTVTKKKTLIGTTSGTSYTAQKLSTGTKYKYVIAAYAKNGGNTYAGTGSSVCTTATKPAKVKNVLAKSVGKDSFTIKWDKQTGVKGYVIERYNINGKLLKQVTTSKTSYKFTKLSKNKTYKIKIKSYINIGNGNYVYGAFSKELSVKTKK